MGMHVNHAAGTRLLRPAALFVVAAGYAAFGLFLIVY
jgi:hypothetical protein